MDDIFTQVPFTSDEFAANPERRCPCVLLLDVSGSMGGKPIQELNRGLIQFKDELMADSMAVKRVEIAIVTFGPVEVQTEFQTPDCFIPPTLVSQADTPMGAAIEKAIAMTRERKDIYIKNRNEYYRPWIFLITDGAPTDNWQNAAEQVHEGEANRAFQFFAVGVEGADFEILKQISTREPLKLSDLRFRELFTWLTKSLSEVSKSQMGEKISLENPVAPGGWASVG